MRAPQRFAIVFAFIFFLSLAAVCQNARIVIPAGSPEDKELAAIAAETDASKRTEAYEEFIKKYSDNKPAIAYAEWQLSQDYLTAHDNAKALAWGDKALEAFPNDLDIVVSDCNVAMASKDNGKTVDYAVKGAAVYQSILQQQKPPEVERCRMEEPHHRQENAAKPSCDFLETAAYNAIASEQNANQRMDYIEQFTPAFPKSQFDAQVSQLAMLSLQQLNQPQRLAAYGEQALAANPTAFRPCS